MKKSIFPIYPLIISMHKSLLVLIIPVFFILTNARGQCDPMPTANLTFVSGSGAGCIWNYTYSISYSGNSFKSVQLSFSCNGGSFTPITSCLPLTGPGITTGTTNNFTCPCINGTTFQLQATYTTSNGSCGGGTLCTEPVVTLILPLKITGLEVKVQNQTPCVKWSAEEASEVEKFIVEYSANGIDFSIAGEVMPQNSSSYTFCDIIERKDGFYRLKVIEKTGIYKYSSVVKFVTSTTAAIRVYPNPATEVLFIEWPANGRLKNSAYTIYNGSGEKILAGKLLQNSIDISILNEGVFYLEVTDSNEKTSRHRFVKIK
jgi:hypothetical protein